MSFGSSPYGSSAFGGSSGSFSVEKARAVNPFTVVVTFSTDVDGSAATLDPTNYQITPPIGIATPTIIKVVLDPQPNSVRLILSSQEYVIYRVDVSTSIQSAYGDQISPLGNWANFTGWPADQRFTARAISNRTVQVLFAQTMAPTAEIFDSVSYVLKDVQGNPVSVLSAVANDTSNVLRVRLNLGASLVPGKPYALYVSDSIITTDGRTLLPNDTTVVWNQPKAKISVPLSRFTGEVRASVELDRSPSERLTLKETLGVIVEPNRVFRNDTVLISDTFVESTSASSETGTLVYLDQQPFLQPPNETTVNPDYGVSFPSDLAVTVIQQSVNLRTKIENFETRRPFISFELLELLETVQVDYGYAGSPDDDPFTWPDAPVITDPLRVPYGFEAHDVAVNEKLSVSALVSGERARIYMATESLGIEESVRVLPEASPQLDKSTIDLFGTPNGQVFFSPSLLPGGGPGPSTISVDEVKVCTRAYDVYKPPVEIDPLPLYTHGGGVVPTLSGSTLSPGVVLFTNFAKLTGAKTNVSNKPKEQVERPVDVGASIVLKQVYDPARFALLNNTAWHLFDNAGLPFIVADNLAPVGPPLTVGPRVYFANPAEDHFAVEHLASKAALAVAVGESLTLSEDHHRFPGVNQIVAAFSETMSLTEGFTHVP